MILLPITVELSVLPSLTAVLLHHSVMDTWTDCSVVSTGLDRKWLFCLQLLQYSYITVLCIHALSLVLLVQGGGEIGIQPAVTTVLLHLIPMELAVLPTSICVICSTLWPLECELNSYGGIELKVHSLTPHSFIFCGQIHAPATLLK